MIRNQLRSVNRGAAPPDAGAFPSTSPFTQTGPDPKRSDFFCLKNLPSCCPQMPGSALAVSNGI